MLCKNVYARCRIFPRAKDAKMSVKLIIMYNNTTNHLAQKHQFCHFFQKLMKPKEIKITVLSGHQQAANKRKKL